jgi:hypothetical protein
MANDNYLKPKQGPVIPELESLETTLAKDQPQYKKIRVLKSSSEDGYVMSRWALTPAQRQVITDGGDVFLILKTFGEPVPPVQIMVAHEVEAQSACDVYGFSIPDRLLPKEK